MKTATKLRHKIYPGNQRSESRQLKQLTSPHCPSSSAASGDGGGGVKQVAAERPARYSSGSFAAASKAETAISTGKLKLRALLVDKLRD